MDAMPPTSLADNTVTSDQAGALGTRAPAPVTPGHGPRTARPLPPRRAQTARLAAATSDRAGSTRAQVRGDRLQRLAGLLRRVPKTGVGPYDPLFDRPDLVEDDYYRFRNQPHAPYVTTAHREGRQP
jgi:hypothetical protein